MGNENKNAPGITRYRTETRKGGYVHHIEEILNYSWLDYQIELATGRPLTFSFSDVIVCVVLHDLEKVWKYAADEKMRQVLARYKSAHDFIFAKAVEHEIPLTPVHINALTYVHGEGNSYDPNRNVQLELSAFVHMFDTWSARGRPAYPLKEHDPWKHG